MTYREAIRILMELYKSPAMSPEQNEAIGKAVDALGHESDSLNEE